MFVSNYRKLTFPNSATIAYWRNVSGQLEKQTSKNMAVQNIQQFQKSITKELLEIKDRVQFLIGNANWGEVGRYKEAILRRAIAQYLPSNLQIGTGFILKNSDHLFGLEPGISTQQDIIIYEGSSPVIFRDGDFVILTEKAVRGVIEVKSKVTNFSDAQQPSQSALNQILLKFNELRQFETFNPIGEHRKKFVGLFAYDYSGTFTDPNVDESLILSNGLVNHICLGSDRFIRYWEDASELEPAIHNGRCYIRYQINSLSFSYFISNLLHIVSDEDPNDRYWFSFPLEGTKELHRTEINPLVIFP